VKTLLLVMVALGLGAAPALALPPQVPDNPGNQGAAHRPSTQSLPTPSSNRALGVACLKLGASKSNENDPLAGTPFSRCVRELAQAIRTACQGKSKSNQNDPLPGTEYSRCVRDLARALRAAGGSTSTAATARSTCRKAQFDTGREFGRCVRVISRELNQHQS
jgi:hypothetical protein